MALLMPGDQRDSPEGLSKALSGYIGHIQKTV